MKSTMEYRPFPPSLKLIISDDVYTLKCETAVPANTCLGMTSIRDGQNLTSVRTPLGAFVTNSLYDYNCCVRSVDLKTFYLWTLRTIEPGEHITIL